MKLKPLVLLTAFMLFTSLIYCQEKKDTVYFDEDWSICEQPVAEYYRVCTLNKDKAIYYKGDAEDYYSDGKIEMKGHYSDEGQKDGNFIFYTHAGKILTQGNYINDEMNGPWLYYDSTGNLKSNFFCKSSTDFTPVLIINSNNDTLLKNGNGKFSFNTQKDFPNIFPAAENYFVQGEVNNYLKNGEFDYFTSEKHDKVFFSELYKNGKFIKGKSYDETTKIPLNLLHLTNEILDKTDVFYHSNFVFGAGTQSDQQVVNLLLNNVSRSLYLTQKTLLMMTGLFLK